MSAGLLKLDSPYMIDDIGDIIVLSDNEKDTSSNEDIEKIISTLHDGTVEHVNGESEEDDDSLDKSQILDVLLPPYQCADDDNNTWLTRVSRAAPSRSAVIQLWEQLDLKLVERQARSEGICAVRGTLFDECFDELIRQVTLDCAERGLLLARVRDEAMMTLMAFQSLFESASEFGGRKAIQAECGSSEAEAELSELESRVSDLEMEVRRLEAWRRQVVRRAAERREVQASLFNEELEALNRSEKQYQLLIETLLASKTSTQT